jgi:transposase
MMIELPDLKTMSDEAKDALIATLWEELQKLRQAGSKKKKSSGLPPSQGFRPQTKDGGSGKVTRKGAGDR